MKTASILSAVILASTLTGAAFASERDAPGAAIATSSVTSRASVQAEAAKANAARLHMGVSERQSFVYIRGEDKAPVMTMSRKMVRDEAVRSAQMGAAYDGLFSRG